MKIMWGLLCHLWIVGSKLLHQPHNLEIKEKKREMRPLTWWPITLYCVKISMRNFLFFMFFQPPFPWLLWFIFGFVGPHTKSFLHPNYEVMHHGACQYHFAFTNFYFMSIHTNHFYQTNYYLSVWTQWCCQKSGAELGPNAFRG